MTTTSSADRAAVADVAGAAGRAATAATTAGVAGVGVDAVDVARFRAILARRPGFALRYFSDAERADAARSPDPTESLAARFAAKEAAMKALGTGLGGFRLTDVEVQRSAGDGDGAATGAPSLVLHGAAATLARERRADHLHLSLTHTHQVAIAFVVAERSPCAPS
jgi:holo-[acyl-carrier protein] synthase